MSPLFLFVKTIENVIRLCTVLKKKSLSGSFEDRAIFHVSQLSYGGGALCAHYRSIDKFVKNGENWPYLQNYHSKIFFSTQCIILLLFLLFSQIKIGGAL